MNGISDIRMHMDFEVNVYSTQVLYLAHERWASHCGGLSAGSGVNFMTGL